DARHHLHRLFGGEDNGRHHQDGESHRARGRGVCPGDEHDARVREDTGQDRGKAGECFRGKTDRAGQGAVRSELGQEHGAEDADRHADDGRQAHHHQGSDDRVTEAAARLEPGRRQLDQHVPPEIEPRAAPHHEHVEDRHERNARENRRGPGPEGQERAQQRAALQGRPLQTQRTAAQSGRAVGDAALNRGYGAGAHLPTFLLAMTMMASPAMFTINVMASSTRAAYMSTATSRGPASGKFSASSAASVLAGEKSERLNWFEFPMSIASAIVSPSARPKPRTSAPNMPVDAVGSITLRIASQRVAPIPYAASLVRYGTCRSASRDTAATVGRIMMASTSAAGSSPGPLKVDPKNGIQPRCV